MARTGEHQPQMTDEDISIGPIAFVDDEDIADLHQARFHGLDLVACLRHQHYQCDICQPGDLNLILANAYRFYQYVIEAASLQ
jgi:hypothetical protein